MLKEIRLTLKIMGEFFSMGKSMVAFALLVASLLYALFKFGVNIEVKAGTDPIWAHIAERRTINEGRWVEVNAKMSNLMTSQEEMKEDMRRREEVLLNAILSSRR